MKRDLLVAGTVLAGLALAGVMVALTGIVPITASSGHWPVTRWFLETAMERSVATHSLFVKERPLDDPGLILKGAGHFAGGCAPCHGAPGAPRPRVVQGMTPQPPDLAEAAERWRSAELFYIIWHGVKLTGMPAWPSRHREDEAWAVAAFVRALPDLEPEEYRWLVQADPPPPGATAEVGPPAGPAPPDRARPDPTAERVPPEVRERCGRCHGAHGLGRGFGVFPKLRGQRPAYLYAALVAYARGERHSGMMEPVAASLDRDAMRALARYYGSLDPAPGGPAGAAGEERRPSVAEGGGPSDAAAGSRPELRSRGEEIARHGLPERKVPSCADCHGPGRIRRNPFYPELAGQYAEYLVLQLELFAGDRRGGSPYAHLMHEVAPRLGPEERRAVALYYASLDPAEAIGTEGRDTAPDRR